MWPSGRLTPQHTDSHPCTRPRWSRSLSWWSRSQTQVQHLKILFNMTFEVSNSLKELDHVCLAQAIKNIIPGALTVAPFCIQHANKAACQKPRSVPNLPAKHAHETNYANKRKMTNKTLTQTETRARPTPPSKSVVPKRDILTRRSTLIICCWEDFRDASSFQATSSHA